MTGFLKLSANKHNITAQAIATTILSFKGSPQVTLGADEVVYSDAFDFELQPRFKEVESPPTKNGRMFPVLNAENFSKSGKWIYVDFTSLILSPGSSTAGKLKFRCV